MPRIYPFANVLKLKRGIVYPVPKEEGLNINLITITPWVELTYKYIQLDLPEYSPEDMIRRYINKELVLDKSAPYVAYKKGNINIISYMAASRDIRLSFKEDHITNKYLESFFLDDAIYDTADSWFTVFEWEAITKEILFHAGDKAFWYRLPVLPNTSIVKEATQSFMEFCFTQLGKMEIYRITPTSYVDETMPPANESVQLNGYIKYRYYA